MKTLLTLIVICISFVARASVDVSIWCTNNNICDEKGKCHSEASYSIGNYVVTQGIRLNADEGVKIILKAITGEIVVTSDVFSEQFSLGNINLSKLNCADQDSHSKIFSLTIPANSNPRIEVIDRGSICWDRWDGEKWVSLKREKYGITFGYSNHLFFKTDYETVSCY